MKKITALSALAIAVAGLLSFSNPQPASIKGTITPARYCVQAWAISESDTLYTTISNGSFEFPNAQPGVYRIVVEALSPYRHMAKDGIVVKDGQPTDVGELSLEKYVAIIK